MMLPAWRWHCARHLPERVGVGWAGTLEASRQLVTRAELSRAEPLLLTKWN